MTDPIRVLLVDDDGREEDAEEQIRGRGERVALRVDGVLGGQEGEPKEHDQDRRLPPTVRGDGVEEEDPGRTGGGGEQAERQHRQRERDRPAPTPPEGEGDSCADDHVDCEERPVQSVLDAACESHAAARDRDDEDHQVDEPVAARPLRRGCVVLLGSEEQAETIHRRPSVGGTRALGYPTEVG